MTALGSVGARVLDWDCLELGTLREVRVDPATRESELLVVDLDAEVAAGPGRGAGVLYVPIRYVFGFREGQIHLDRSLGALLRTLPVALLPVIGPP